MAQKVFCIGFHKTGTSSLAIALNLLNYDVCRRLGMLQDQLPGSDIIKDLKANHYVDILSVIDKFDAFCDNPWPLLYQEIDEKYPNSKFILSIRNEQEWLNSVLNYFKDSSSEIRSIIYDGKGSPIGNESHYLGRYQRHNEEVKSYFKDRPSDLLLFDINKVNKWETLCHFLGKEIPKQPFPFKNKTVDDKDFLLESTGKKRLSLKLINSLFSLPLSSILLVVETIIFISIARLVVIFFPFRFIAKLLGNHQVESTEKIPVFQQEVGRKIGKTIRKISTYTPFRSLCFEQALTSKFMLNLRGISSTIYFGVAKEASNLKAHAWVRSGHHTLTGNKDKDQFIIVSTFGSKARQ